MRRPTMSTQASLSTTPVSSLSSPSRFPFSLADPADVTLTWTLERAHWPEPMSPLVFAIAGEALAKGLSAAMRAYAFPVAELRVQRINTYRYQAMVPAAISPEERTAQDKRAKEQLRAVASQLSPLWRSTWLPEVQA